MQQFSNRIYQDNRKASKSEIDKVSQGDLIFAADHNDIERISDMNTPKAASTMRVIVTDSYQNI